MKTSIISVFLLAFLPSVVMADDISDPFSELDFDQLMQLKITSVSKKSEKLSEAYTLFMWLQMMKFDALVQLTFPKLCV
ncbi:hypothetical protein ACLKMH_00920 [Psychromonas sp. KJ10-10]|uniref:hypothetical protein n=1 Tax=Psychromonas sp. KJ10-10 TaxID=3391823 RepID=UPI0039B49154